MTRPSGESDHWELYKKLKFDHTSKLYIDNPESVQENDTHSFLRIREANRSTNTSQKTRLRDNQQKMKPGDGLSEKKEIKKKDKCLNLAGKLKNY